jgi:uncharacterized protein YdaL
MTADQLRRVLDNEFGLKKWPETYQVSPETYANVCQAIFEFQFEQEELYWDTHDLSQVKSKAKVLSIAVGKANKGIMFKNVELIMVRN